MPTDQASRPTSYCFKMRQNGRSDPQERREWHSDTHELKQQMVQAKVQTSKSAETAEELELKASARKAEV